MRNYLSTDCIDTKSIIREYYGQVYINNYNNLGEIDKFLEKCKLPKPMQEKVNNLDISLSLKVI